MPTIRPRSSNTIYVVTYYIKWVTTSWTYSICTKNLFGYIFSIKDLGSSRQYGAKEPRSLVRLRSAIAHECATYTMKLCNITTEQTP